jgi:hypothetical protein
MGPAHASARAKNLKTLTSRKTGDSLWNAKKKKILRHAHAAMSHVREKDSAAIA